MNRTLRILFALAAICAIAVAAFAMGFGAASLVNGSGESRQASSAAPVTAPVLTSPATDAAAPASLAPTPLANSTPSSSSIVADTQSKFGLFWEALRKVSDSFYDQKALETQKIVYGAIKGAVESLGDPHTYFQPPEQLQQNQQYLQGSFEGIGATIETKDNKLLIVAPISGTPAQKAGLRAGDWIVKIDDKPTDGITVNEGVNLIRGKKGTPVTLTIAREGSAEPLTFTIIRDTINVPTVNLTVLDGGIAHLQLVDVFGANTGPDVKKALQSAKQQGATKVILDLRNNPGGYLLTAVDVASQFLKDGVVVSELFRDGKNTPYNVRPGGLATDWPIVVLINKGSASASEIVAGAIQDSGRGPLIGETTFGKGSVQQDMPLSDGSAVHVTIANWLTPKGRNISKAGLVPNIEVKLTDDDVKAVRDPQLQRAIDYLTTGK